MWFPSRSPSELRSIGLDGVLATVPLDNAYPTTFAGIAFDVMDIPGHSAGHVAFHHDGELFSGDLLFAGGIGRFDLTGGSWDVLLESVRTLMDRFPPETVVYPGHGEPTTLGRELQSNPFLRELRA